jgi:hypothetical protein
MAEQPPFVGRGEDRRPAQLAGTADVVDERRGEQQIGTQARMDLGELATERRYADRVLEQAAGIRVMTVRRRRIRPQWRFRERPRDDSVKRVVVHFADEKLDEALELVGVPPKARSQLRRVDTLGRLERPYLDLELVPEPLDPPEHAHRVARLEPPVEQVDVVRPLPSTSSSER